MRVRDNGFLTFSIFPTGPYAIHMKYRDRTEVNNWTFNCRNEEQVNLWCREITRLLDIWKAEEKGIRRSAKATLQAMKEQTITQQSSVESLDTMRSAPRPVHPYHYTFESAPNKTRARNGSLDLGSKPDVSNGIGRNRSCSVTSAAPDTHYPQDQNQDDNPPPASNSVTDLGLSPGPGSSNGDRSAVSSHESSAAFSPHRPSKRNGLYHTRTASQNSDMSIGYASSTTDLSKFAPDSGHLSGRTRMSPLPPQLPPTLGPQPPLSIDEILSPITALSTTYDRSLHSLGDVKPLPVPPSNLRQRVGDRLPAPLAPAPSPSPEPVQGSVPTPQSTLPELPSLDARRPLSNRKSNTPLRGPRERGQAARTPSSAHQPEEASEAISRSRARSLSNPLVNGAVVPKVPGPDVASVSRSSHKRHRRQGSESSYNTTDSASIFTTSETSGQGSSPGTPPPFGEENKPSPFGVQAVDHGRSREPHLVSSAGCAIGRRAVSGSKLDLLESPPAYYAGVTPKTSGHSSTETRMAIPGSETRLEDASSGQCSNRRGRHSHTRSTSATGIGRTNLEAAPTISVRIHYDNSRFMLRMSHATSRREFVEKIRQKIRLCGAVPLHSIPYDQLDPSQFAPEERVTYLNESNVFVPLDSDRDFANAWTSVKCRRRDSADNDILILAVGSTEHVRY